MLAIFIHIASFKPLRDTIISVKKKKTQTELITAEEKYDSNRPFHITVGTSIQPGSKVDFEHELRLLKAALLYADKVKLCSLSSSLLVPLAQIKDLTKNEKIDVAAMMFQAFVDSSEDESVRQMSSLIPTLAEMQRRRKIKQEIKRHLSPDAFLIIHRLDKAFQGFIGGIETAVDSGINNITGGVKLNELEYALKNDLIEFQEIDPNTSHVVEDYFDLIKQAINSDKTYPLLDSSTSNLVSLAIKEGKIEIPDISLARARGVGLSADILSKLPLFDMASVDEIIDIRQELERPLVRFRSAMIEYSEEIKSSAWDKDFPLECESIFRKRVQPAILDIEEAVKANKRLHVLTKTFVNEKGLVTASSLGLLLASANNLIDTVSQFFTIAAIPTATILMKSEMEYRDKSKEIEQNQLYFYYKSGEKLKSKYV